MSFCSVFLSPRILEGGRGSLHRDSAVVRPLLGCCLSVACPLLGHGAAFRPQRQRHKIDNEVAHSPKKGRKLDDALFNVFVHCSFLSTFQQHHFNNMFCDNSPQNISEHCKLHGFVENLSKIILPKPPPKQPHKHRRTGRKRMRRGHPKIILGDHHLIKFPRKSRRRGATSEVYFGVMFGNRQQKQPPNHRRTEGIGHETRGIPRCAFSDTF